MNQSSKTLKSSGKFTEYGDRLNERAMRYEAKIRKMDEVIKIASDSEEKYLLKKMKNVLINIHVILLLD